MKTMITGQYIIGDSVIHRLDPRSKVLCCFAIILAVALPHHYIGFLLLNLAAIIGFIYLSHLGLARVLEGLRYLRVLFLLTFVCQVFLTPGDILWTLGTLSISRQGIHLGIATFLRLVILYLAASLLSMSTSPLQLSAGLESLLSPLKYLRVPVHKFAIIINISLRFVPTILEEVELISRAQKSRGARFDSGPLLLRLRTMLALLIPLLAVSLQRANDLALAMESRCYAAGSTNYSRADRLRFSWIDWTAIAVVIAIFLLPVFVLG